MRRVQTLKQGAGGTPHTHSPQATVQVRVSETAKLPEGKAACKGRAADPCQREPWAQPGGGWTLSAGAETFVPGLTFAVTVV